MVCSRWGYEVLYRRTNGSPVKTRAMRQARPMAFLRAVEMYFDAAEALAPRFAAEQPRDLLLHLHHANARSARLLSKGTQKSFESQDFLAVLIQPSSKFLGLVFFRARVSFRQGQAMRIRDWRHFVQDALIAGLEVSDPSFRQMVLGRFGQSDRLLDVQQAVDHRVGPSCWCCSCTKISSRR